MNKKLRTIEEAVAYLMTADVATWEPKDRSTCPTAYSANIDPYTNGEEFKFVLLMDGQREPALMTNDEREVIDWANGLMECLSCVEEWIDGMLKLCGGITMDAKFNSKDMIHRYIEFMNDELIKYNTKFFEHWSDLSEEMKISFREDFGEDTCKRFNYFIVIWNTDWNNWSVYLADDVLELMNLANCIVKYYYKEDFENLTENLLQWQEIIFKNTKIGGYNGKKA